MKVTFTSLHEVPTIQIHNMWLDAGMYQRRFLDAYMCLYRAEEYGALESERQRHGQKH